MKKPLFQRKYNLSGSTEYTEDGSDNGAKLATSDVDEAISHYISDGTHLGYAEMLRWVDEQHFSEGDAVKVPLSADTPEALSAVAGGGHPRLILMMRPLHTIEELNDFLYATNRLLPDGGYLWCHAMTAGLKRKLLMEKHPGILGWASGWLHYLWHRVFPKLWLTRRMYFLLTTGKNRTYSRVELIGRLYRAGFEMLDEHFQGGEFVMLLHKVQPPADDTAPTGSPIVRLKRIGLNGKEITVYKLRTMHTYSEYVQPYVYHYQSLERGGKFKKDYRVSTYGRLLRRTWLDELPMLWNMLRGDLKLVGVRPLSHHYFSLYTPEMQALRIKVKPGMLPPFYYEGHTPETLEEVQESERRYIEAYLKAPFTTDWRYFWGIVGNIVFKRKRSK